MAEAENKTTANDSDVAAFIAAVPDARRREEADVLDALHRRVTGQPPQMWGPSIIGYGAYHYRYDSGREGTSCRAGFSPRKAGLAIYLNGDLSARRAEADALFAALGKHSMGQVCLTIKRLDSVNIAALEGLVRLSWDAMNAAYPE